VQFSARRSGFATAFMTALAAATACVVVASSGSSAASTAGHHGFGAAAGAAIDQAAATLSSGRQPLPPGQLMLGSGRVGTRSQVPWRLVGPGWTLAEFTTGSYRVARPVTLCMIDPAGGKYRMYQWAATRTPWQLVDWSGDKKRALLEQPAASRLPMHELVLATGQLTSFRLPSAADVLGYTRPDGTAILVADHGIVRYSRTGVLERRLVNGSQYNAALSSPSGLTELVNGKIGVELVSNLGGVERRLPVPGTDPSGGCALVRWWTSTAALVRCESTSAARLWMVPVSGAAPTAVTPSRSGLEGPDFGDLDAWRLPSGRYVQALGACGSIFIGKEGKHGKVSIVNVAGSSGNNVVVATVGGQFLVLEFSGCFPDSSLAWFNPATGAVENVLAAPANRYGVYSVVAYDRNGEQPGKVR